MKNANIDFVRKYEAYGCTWFDVIYKSRRCYTYNMMELPKTVWDFVTTANDRKEQFDKTFNRYEMIYSA